MVAGDRWGMKLPAVMVVPSSRAHRVQAGPLAAETQEERPAVAKLGHPVLEACPQRVACQPRQGLVASTFQEPRLLAAAAVERSHKRTTQQRSAMTARVGWNVGGATMPQEIKM